mgnify:CR=1 FL=1
MSKDKITYNSINLFVDGSGYQLYFNESRDRSTSQKVRLYDKTKSVAQGRLIEVASFMNNVDTLGIGIGDKFAMHCKTEVELLDYLASKFNTIWRHDQL